MAGAEFVPVVSFASHPDRYVHWRLTLNGPVATLMMDVQEDRGHRSDYVLKQNSYDLSVDIELHDAVERLRFEHPEVRTVVVTGPGGKVFCAGANIQMLGSSTHHFKVNFCKYTNETRVGIEQASAESGQTWIAGLNGTAAGGGYELALACDEIWLIDDRSSAVSLPEVPLLAVLPGTGGLTRLVDKRHVRRDVADVFCTKAEGFRARDAVATRIVDGSLPRSQWEAGLSKIAVERAAQRPARALQGIELPALDVEIDANGGRAYRYVQTTIDAAARTATVIVRAPDATAPGDAADWLAQGASAWSLRAFRELDDALIHLRFNHPTVGLLLLHTEGDAAAVLAHDAALTAVAGTWIGDEVRWHQARVLRRLDNMSKSMFALVAPGSCFVGVLAEILWSVDRTYMLAGGDAQVVVTSVSAGALPMANGLTRLATRFLHDPADVSAVLARAGEPLDGEEALELGIVTAAPDDLDWDDEIRIAVEERVSLSPDALTGMEQNLRFAGPETCETKIYGRLSAWQNWIFQRPNAVGERGALTLYGHPTSPSFDWGRT